MNTLFDTSILAAAAAPAQAKPVFAATTLGNAEWLAASSALTTDTVVAVPGMLRPFHAWQAAAYLHLQSIVAAWGGALLGDDMGLGKTQVMLAAAADAVAQGGYAIVIAPPVALSSWKNDMRDAFPGLRLHAVKGRTVKPLPAADIYFFNDDPLTLKAWLVECHKDARGHEQFTGSAFVNNAAIILRDEIHRDKGNQGKATTRAKVMLAVGNAVRQARGIIIGATGTLVTNRPVEAYIPLQIVGGTELVKAITPGATSHSGYLWRYCAPETGTAMGGRKYTKFGTDYAAAADLHTNLRRSVYVRREKSDLGDNQLPHSGWIVTPLALNGDSMLRYDRVVREFLTLIAEEKGPEAAMRANRAETITKMNAMREEAGVAKAQAAVDYINDLTNDGHQVVVFYEHTRVLVALMDHLTKAGISHTYINGSNKGNEREYNVADFQAGEYQVVLAQIQAAGMACTLTAAPHAVFVQVGWSAGQLKQCSDRILRVDDITKARAAAGEKVQWHVLQACYDDGDPSFDAAIWSVLEDKCRLCDEINAGREITMPEGSVQELALQAWYPSVRKSHGGW